MTPVDLNRLREALRGLNDVVAAAQGKLPRYRRTIEAVARGVTDAPIEWRCTVSGADTVRSACGHDPDETGCGWRALVPIKENP